MMKAQRIRDIISEYEADHGLSGYWGIRALCPDEDYIIGDTPRESYDWDLEWDCSTRNTTGETIGGTCAVGIADIGDIESIKRAIDGAGLYAGLKGRLALIHADSMRYGNDPGEIILSGFGPFESCEVVAVWVGD